MTETAAAPSQIETTLERLFRRHRIVVWADPAGEFKDDLESLTLSGVESFVVDNNEFSVKQTILRQRPDDRFLLYRGGEAPADAQNWLLDVELAFCRFEASREILVASDIGIPAELSPMVAEHDVFFRSTKRQSTLAARIVPDETRWGLQRKMLAVCAKADEETADAVLRALLGENAAQSSEAMKLVGDCALDEALWGYAAEHFGYSASAPTIEDFSLWLFKRAVVGFRPQTETALATVQANAALIFFRTWQDSVTHASSFRYNSDRASRVLAIEDATAALPLADLLPLTAFRAYDIAFIRGLAKGIHDRTITARDSAMWIRDRRRSFWASEFDHLYQALDAASEFLALLDTFSPAITNFDDGLTKYKGTWYQIDQYYRQFIYHARAAEAPAVLEDLRLKVENFYSNKFLRPLGDSWQKCVDVAKPWISMQYRSQREFFNAYVQPALKGGRNKIVVIISDALRYEAADELRTRIRQADRFDASIELMLCGLPSYTQLGMAALLPNRELEIEATDKAWVRADGESTTGTASRAKRLEAHEGAAIQADTLLGYTQDETRELLKSVQVLYVYHNRIDKTGDNRDSERQVFDATETTFTELMLLLKKLASANVSNMLITADHGFIYQDAELPESEFLSEEAHGDEVLYRDRRFVIGRGLKESAAFTKFRAADLKLAGDLEVLIPNSIGRLRRQGSGSRFVHGGASLQEICVPVVHVNKKRSSDVKSVTVELTVRSTTITTSQILVDLYQAEAVTEKTQSRALRVGLFAGETLISQSETIVFDRTAEDPRERAFSVQLVLGRAADAFDGQTVELRLDEQVPRTNHFQVYAKSMYTLRRSFKSDFDF